MIERAPQQAFTLVELICVMALLATILAFSAPALSRSTRERHLKEESLRMLALIEYARDEAVSRGLSTVVWIDPAAGRAGMRATDDAAEADGRNREFQIGSDLRIEAGADVRTRNGVVEVVTFNPGGTPEATSVQSLVLADRNDSLRTIARTADGWGYEILKQETP